MKRRTILAACISSACGLCLALEVGRAAPADTAPQARCAIARKAYDKLRMAYENAPDRISADEVSRASLEWFKAAALVKSKPEAIKAATEYLEREGGK